RGDGEAAPRASVPWLLPGQQPRRRDPHRSRQSRPSARRRTSLRPYGVVGVSSTNVSGPVVGRRPKRWRTERTTTSARDTFRRAGKGATGLPWAPRGEERMTPRYDWATGCGRVHGVGLTMISMEAQPPTAGE